MGKQYTVTNDHGDAIHVELDDDIDDAELEPTPDNLPDQATLDRVCAEAENDDFQESGEETDTDE